ncbi:hypothetical protein ZWY2020_035238 [Hordeum vulgare]|nr:hypothetical protein ZWY2020_035238 [Hordeum vulgare]
MLPLGGVEATQPRHPLLPTPASPNAPRDIPSSFGRHPTSYGHRSDRAGSLHERALCCHQPAHSSLTRQHRPSASLPPTSTTSVSCPTSWPPSSVIAEEEAPHGPTPWEAKRSGSGAPLSWEQGRAGGTGYSPHPWETRAAALEGLPPPPPPPPFRPLLLLVGAALLFLLRRPPRRCCYSLASDPSPARAAPVEADALPQVLLRPAPRRRICPAEIWPCAGQLLPQAPPRHSKVNTDNIILTMASEEDVKQRQVVEDRARNISHNVRCTECGSQSIEDSQADVAVLLRRLIRDEIKSGKSDKEIYKKLEEDFGETVLYAPKFDLQTAAIWLSPVIVGGVAAGVWAYQKHRQRTNVHIMALNLVRGVPLTPREKETMIDILTPPPPARRWWWPLK